MPPTRSHRRRPAPAAADLDLNLVLIHNLLRTPTVLGASVDTALRGQRLTAAQFNTLLVLRAAGAVGLRMGQIGERLVVTKSNVTGLVDRLEAQDLVARGAVADRRAIPVRLTAAGAALIADVIPRYAVLAADLTAGLTATEKRALVRLLTKLRRGWREHRRGTG